MAVYRNPEPLLLINRGRTRRQGARCQYGGIPKWKVDNRPAKA